MGLTKGDQPLEIVYRAAGEAEAHVIRGRLEQEGIRVLLRTGTGGAQGVPGGSLGGVQILVPAQEADQARMILGADPTSTSQ